MKIAIVGTGHVGATIAYTLLIRELGNELILINRNLQKAESDAIDLRHTQAFTEKNRPIRAVPLDKPLAADLYILCLSVPYEPHYTSRFQLAPGNYRLFAEIVPRLKALNPEAVFIIVSNPVDVMTYFAIELGGMDASKVMGVGTLIDSARFRKRLSEQKGIHPDDIRAYILGEHGDSQFHATSIAYAGGEAITTEEESAALVREYAGSGYQIVRGKGYSNFAIAMATELLVESICLNNQRTIPISTLIQGYMDEEEVCLSLPAILGRQGIIRVLSPELSAKEQQAFKKSAEAVRKVIRQVKEEISR
jgi:L-lactate dehydrogenase